MIFFALARNSSISLRLKLSRQVCRIHAAFALLALTVCLALASPAQANPPVMRIGYLEAGSFWLFDNTWNAFRDGMAKYDDMHCEYPANARLSPGWEPENMRRLPELARQLLQRKDIDLVVGMGTAAVKALLAVNDGRLPILGMGMADPIAAGVVKSAQGSGVDNFT